MVHPKTRLTLKRRPLVDRKHWHPIGEWSRKKNIIRRKENYGKIF